MVQPEWAIWIVVPIAVIWEVVYLLYLYRKFKKMNNDWRHDEVKWNGHDK